MADIQEFVSAQIRQHIDESGVGVDLEARKYAKVVYQITRRADGVFLWAHLVARSVISGIIHGDSVDMLKHRVETTPPNLDGLFDKMLANLDPAGRSRSRRMLLLALHCPFMGGQLMALDFSWLDDLEADDFPLNIEFQPYDAKELEKRCQHVRRQLAAYTYGLLEITDHWASGSDKLMVRFFHRTARDYINDQSACSWNEGNAINPNGCIPSLGRYYQGILLARMKFHPASISEDLQSFHSMLRFTSYHFPRKLLREVEVFLNANETFGRGLFSTADCQIYCMGYRCANSLSFFLSAGQASYALFRLKEDLCTNKPTPEETARLLIASRFVTNEDAEFFEFCFENMLVRPNVEIGIQVLSTHQGDRKRMHSIWLVLLHAIAAGVWYHGALHAPSPEPTASIYGRILKCFLEHGADRSVAVIVQQEKAASELSYLEIPQLLQLVVPTAPIEDIKALLQVPWRDIIGHQLAKGLSLISAPLGREEPQNILPVRRRYKPAIPELLKNPKAWEVHGVATDTEKLVFQWMVNLL